jgi:hypothetical protein
MQRFATMALALSVTSVLTAQTRKPASPTAPPTPSKPAPQAHTTKTAPEIMCPSPLGVGISTKLTFCDVMTGRDPAAGILIEIPPHKGPLTLTFDLHNRQTYSEEQVKANRAYARYTATIGVLTMDNTLIGRAVVQSEFRKASDLVDRIGGGAGPGGVKAVAPTGLESISMTIPEGESRLSILGEKLTSERADGSATYTSPGRPIAVISNVQIEYQPAPQKVIRKKGA